MGRVRRKTVPALDDASVPEEPQKQAFAGDRKPPRIVRYSESATADADRAAARLGVVRLLRALLLRRARRR